MNFSSPIKIPDYSERGARKYRRKPKSGRFYIFCMFLWLRAIDAATLHYLYPHLSPIYQRYMVVSLVTTAAWTTGLLLAIWFRHNWARYLLVATLLATVISTLAMIPGLPDTMQPKKQLSAILAITAVYLPVALVLIMPKSIDKLACEKYGKIDL